jgi:hypothetical protein
VIQTFDFSEALRLMKRGYRVRRAAWCSTANWLGVVSGHLAWQGMSCIEQLSEDAILAEDWHLVDAEGGK